MTRRSQTRLFVPLLLAALSLGVPLTVSAQPGGPAAGGDAGAPASASAATGDAGAPPATATASASATATIPLPTPTVRKRVELPPPTPQQVNALKELQGELGAYQDGARDYKDTLTSIITMHYEEKRNAILSGLNREITAEEAEQTKARNIAIQRLEAFVAKYSGPNANEEATPDAMFRLGALYEERGKASDDPAALPEGLKQSVRMYKRIVLQFPKYKELPAVVYFIGHALNDLGRLPEAQQVWRSLVCHNHYDYKPTPVSADNATEPADSDPVQPMPGDNTQDYWIAWRAKYYDVQHLEAAMKAGTEDTKFQDPYPQDCTPLAQPGLAPGQEPKYVQEIWFRIGEWEFGQDDLPGGVIEGDANFAVWDYNRSARAYEHSLDYKTNQKIYQVTLYKYAWTLFKQQRYHAAVTQFLRVLDFTDELEKRTGESGANFRDDALQYIAGSLTQEDFEGPPPEEPYIMRDDVTIKDPAHAEEVLAIGIKRVQDNGIIPQDKEYTRKVYIALAKEYETFPQWHNAITTYELFLQKWPLDEYAPDAQNGIAIAYDNLARITADPKKRAEYEKAVIDARTQLSKYVGTTEWTDANKENTAALQHAEDLVHSGLKQAAAAHKQRGELHENLARQANRDGNTEQAIEELQSALTEFKLEATAWKGYLEQDETAADAYDSRYFYAEALHAMVNDEFVLWKAKQDRFPEPPAADIQAARQAAVDSRDSEEDDTHLDNAAFFVVHLADIQRDIAGIKKEIVLHDAEYIPSLDADKNVIVETVPAPVLGSMEARDEYLRSVPLNLDTTNRTPEYQYYPGLQYFVYGHFKEAQERLTPVYQTYCGKNPIGYEAWKRLIRIANMTRDTQRSTELANAEKSHSCAVTPEQMADEPGLINPTLQRANYMQARATFLKAQAETNPDERKKLFKLAAGQYESALQADPYDDDAPEAAMNAAYSYKQINDPDDALRMYGTFIQKYGNDQILDALKKGGPDPRDPKKTIPPDQQKYQERLGCVRLATEEQSRTAYQFFDYPTAASEFAQIAKTPRFDDPAVTCDQKKTPLTDGNKWRQQSARTALVLYENLGDAKGMNDVYATLQKMPLQPEVRAEADYRMQAFVYDQYQKNPSDAGARARAYQAMAGYYAANRTKPEAAPYALEAAYRIAKIQQGNGDPGYKQWMQSTVDAWNFFSKNPSSDKTATDFPYRDYGAEADFTLLDDQLCQKFYHNEVIKGCPQHHVYTGKSTDVKTQYEKDKLEADNTWKPKLSEIATKYQSKKWTPAALARIGALYDSLRMGLDAYAPQYFTPQEEDVLNQLATQPGPINLPDPDHPGQMKQYPDGQAAADAARDAVRAKWHSVSDAYLEGATQSMITYYVQGAIFAQRANVTNDAVRGAVNRLAWYTARADFQDAKMRQYVEKVQDPTDTSKTVTYTDGMFLHWRNGQESPNPPQTGVTAPLPPAVQ